MKYRLFISIVPHNSGELVAGAASSAGARGGTVVMGRGTASNGIIQFLGLGEKAKDIVFIVVDDSTADDVWVAIRSAAMHKGEHFGILFSIDVDSFIRQGQISASDNQGEKDMDSTYRMITAIVNKGYAEDAMAAARKAGAHGGTIISARGTAKAGDEKFFGVEIVPEKDMLVVLVEKDKADGIIDAIRTLPCLEKPGSGIVFCSEVQNFTSLGGRFDKTES